MESIGILCIFGIVIRKKRLCGMYNFISENVKRSTFFPRVKIYCYVLLCILKYLPRILLYS